MHMQQPPTEESRDVAVPQASLVERVFAGAGALTVALCGVAVAIDLAPQLDLFAITFGVLFGIANLRWWRIIVRALLAPNQASTVARQFFFVCNLAFKVSLLLLVIYGLSRWGREAARSFLIGFVGFLSFGGVLLLIIRGKGASVVDSETPSQ